jgi:copper chaperone NosL
MKTAGVILMTVWTLACATRAAGPPVIVVDRSACSRCGMLISEPAYAAAVRSHDGHDQLYDDIGCLIASIGSAAPSGARYWFHDAADGAWITDGNPVFVVSARLRTPMGGGIAAYRDRSVAERAAERQGGRLVLSLDDLALTSAPGAIKERGER